MAVSDTSSKTPASTAMSGAAIAVALGILAVIVGVFFLPWAQGTLPTGGTETLSAMRVRSVLDTDGTQATIVGLGTIAFFATIGAAALLLTNELHVLRADDALDAKDSGGILVVVMAGTAWTGYVAYLINAKLSDASLDLARSGIDAGVGNGAWLTLAGGIVLVSVATRALLQHQPSNH